MKISSAAVQILKFCHAERWGKGKAQLWQTSDGILPLTTFSNPVVAGFINFYAHTTAFLF